MDGFLKNVLQGNIFRKLKKYIYIFIIRMKFNCEFFLFGVKLFAEDIRLFGGFCVTE